jgi:GNAT superfamily N-acetyltransferase
LAGCFGLADPGLQQRRCVAAYGDQAEESSRSYGSGDAEVQTSRSRSTVRCTWGLARGERGSWKAPAPARVARVEAKLADSAALMVIGSDRSTVLAMALAEPGRQDFGAGWIVPDVGHISMVFVAPDRWGERVGTELMNALHHQMLAHGWDTASLWTRTSNQRARRLYGGRGYHATDDVSALETGDDIVRYEMRLDQPV